MWPIQRMQEMTTSGTSPWRIADITMAPAIRIEMLAILMVRSAEAREAREGLPAGRLAFAQFATPQTDGEPAGPGGQLSSGEGGRSVNTETEEPSSGPDGPVKGKALRALQVRVAIGLGGGLDSMAVGDNGLTVVREPVDAIDDLAQHLVLITLQRQLEPGFHHHQIAAHIGRRQSDARGNARVIDHGDDVLEQRIARRDRVEAAVAHG